MTFKETYEQFIKETEKLNIIFKNRIKPVFISVFENIKKPISSNIIPLFSENYIAHHLKKEIWLYEKTFKIKDELFCEFSLHEEYNFSYIYVNVPIEYFEITSEEIKKDLERRI